MRQAHIYLGISYDHRLYTPNTLKLDMFIFDDDSSYAQLVDSLVTFCTYPLSPNPQIFNGDRLMSGYITIACDHTLTNKLTILKAILNAYVFKNPHLTYLLVCQIVAGRVAEKKTIVGSADTWTATVAAYDIFYAPPHIIDKHF